MGGMVLLQTEPSNDRPPSGRLGTKPTNKESPRDLAAGGRGKKMQATVKTIDQWETAWAAYIEAEDIFQCCWRLRYDRGHRRAWNSACVRRRKCIEALRRLDAEFCDRLGIN